MIDLKKNDIYLKDESLKISDALKYAFENGPIEQFAFDIDVKKLNIKYLDKINITSQGDFIPIFQKLKDFDEHPALYFFQINPMIAKEEIIPLISDVFRTYELNIPAQNKSKSNSGVLYVGKVKRCAWGRLIQHLGYHKNRRSHGLQLGYWSTKTKLNIQLSYHVFFYDKDMADNINLLERRLATLLKPIIRRH